MKAPYAVLGGIEEEGVQGLEEHSMAFFLSEESHMTSIISYY
jgi:hypothetical protein